jgi:hypothetical protein
VKSHRIHITQIIVLNNNDTNWLEQNSQSAVFHCLKGKYNNKLITRTTARTPWVRGGLHAKMNFARGLPKWILKFPILEGRRPPKECQVRQRYGGPRFEEKGEGIRVDG